MDRNNDGMYDNDQDCWWTLVANHKQTIELYINSVQLEESSTCLFDFLEVSCKLSPHICFIIGVICDLIVARNDSWMLKGLTRTVQIYVIITMEAEGEGWDPLS